MWIIFTVFIRCSLQDNILNIGKMKEYIFKDNPKKWLTYFNKIIQTNIYLKYFERKNENSTIKFIKQGKRLIKSFLKLAKSLILLNYNNDDKSKVITRPLGLIADSTGPNVVHFYLDKKFELHIRIHPQVQTV